jgi:hypothetical protein
MFTQIMGIIILAILAGYAFLLKNPQPIEYQAKTVEQALIYDSHMYARQAYCKSLGNTWHIMEGKCTYTKKTCNEKGRKAIHKAVYQDLSDAITESYLEWSDDLDICMSSPYAFPVRMTCEKYEKGSGSREEAAGLENGVVPGIDFAYKMPSYACIEVDQDTGRCSRYDTISEPVCEIQPHYCEDVKQVDYDYNKKECDEELGQYIAEAILGTTVVRRIKEKGKICFKGGSASSGGNEALIHAAKENGGGGSGKQSLDCLNLFMSAFTAGFYVMFEDAMTNGINNVNAHCKGSLVACADLHCGDRKMSKSERAECMVTKCKDDPDGKSCFKALFSFVEFVPAGALDLVGTLIGLIPGVCSKGEDGQVDSDLPVCGYESFMRFFIKYEPFIVKTAVDYLVELTDLCLNIADGDIEDVLHNVLYLGGGFLYYWGLNVHDVFSNWGKVAGLW